MLSQSLSGKKALITGAGGGIGRAIALLFAQHGASVALWDVANAGLDATLAAVEDAGGRGVADRVDITDVSGLSDAVRRAAEALGGLDVLVNAAGVNACAPALDVTEEAWDRVVDINAKGSFFVAQAFARHWLAQTAHGRTNESGGRIINISSSLSQSVLPDRVPYLVSKGGVNLLTKALALEWAAHGITVNAVGPAIVDTEMTRNMGSSRAVPAKMLLGRFIKAEEIAAAAVFLASNAAAMITGQVIFVDAGWTIH